MTARRRLSPELRRAELLHAAEKVIRKLGHQARVEDVVEEAGAAKGTFFVYFPTWLDLVIALRARAFEQFDGQYPLKTGKTPDWTSITLRLAEGFVDFTVGMGKLHDVIFHGEIEGEPEGAGGSAIARIAALIRAGQTAGQFGRLDPEPAARALFAMLHATADAVAAGAPRDKEVATLRLLIRRCLAP
jgi:AcrR family transcriptional regulator